MDLDNLLRLLEERDDRAVQPGRPTSEGSGRGVLTTDEVRTALLGHVHHDGLGR